MFTRRPTGKNVWQLCYDFATSKQVRCVNFAGTCMQRPEHSKVYNLRRKLNRTIFEQKIIIALRTIPK